MQTIAACQFAWACLVLLGLSSLFSGALVAASLRLFARARRRDVNSEAALDRILATEERTARTSVRMGWLLQEQINASEDRAEAAAHPTPGVPR